MTIGVWLAGMQLPYGNLTVEMVLLTSSNRLDIRAEYGSVNPAKIWFASSWAYRETPRRFTTVLCVFRHFANFRASCPAIWERGHDLVNLIVTP